MNFYIERWCWYFHKRDLFLFLGTSSGLYFLDSPSFNNNFKKSKVHISKILLRSEVSGVKFHHMRIIAIPIKFDFENILFNTICMNKVFLQYRFIRFRYINVYHSSWEAASTLHTMKRNSHFPVCFLFLSSFVIKI